jgi:hypothetical protein
MYLEKEGKIGVEEGFLFLRSRREGKGGETPRWCGHAVGRSFIPWTPGQTAGPFARLWCSVGFLYGIVSEEGF